jgi:hypothetical protein
MRSTLCAFVQPSPVAQSTAFCAELTKSVAIFVVSIGALSHAAVSEVVEVMVCSTASIRQAVIGICLALRTFRRTQLTGTRQSLGDELASRAACSAGVLSNHLVVRSSWVLAAEAVGKVRPVTSQAATRTGGASVIAISFVLSVWAVLDTDVPAQEDVRSGGHVARRAVLSLGVAGLAVGVAGQAFLGGAVLVLAIWAGIHAGCGAVLQKLACYAGSAGIVGSLETLKAGSMAS